MFNKRLIFSFKLNNSKVKIRATLNFLNGIIIVNGFNSGYQNGF